MSKFTSIEMSDLVALHPKVESHKFLGMFEHVCYKPTNSKIESYRNYYNASEAEVLIRLSEEPEENFEQCISANKELQITDNNAEYRMDLCLSHDCCFAAFQVFQLRQGEYTPVSKLRILEGEKAKSFENLLA